MPHYAYLCKEGHEFEVEQKITDEPLDKCKECGAPLQRLISKSSFVLKGKGWERDGYSHEKK